MARKSELVTLRADARHVAIWRAAAVHDDVSLSELLRRAADWYARTRLTVDAQQERGVAR